MPAVRPLAVLAVPAAIAASVALTAGPAPGPAGGDAAAPASEAVVPAPGSGPTTWFCAPGTAEGDDGFAELTVVLANAGDEAVAGSMTVLGGAEPVEHDVEVPARGRLAVRVADLTTAAWAGAVIELDAGGVAAEARFDGPDGVALAPCDTAPAQQAWLPVGATEPGAREVITLLNPFPAEAVVTLTFETESGARTPQDLERLIVPARSLAVVDVGDHVAVRREVAATLVATTGQVVVGRVSAFDGSEARRGLTASLAARTLSDRWWFPAARLEEGRGEVLVITNPDPERVARVDVRIVTDDGEPPAPFAVDVAAGRYAVLALDRDDRIAPGARFAIAVESLEGVGVVAELATVHAEGAATSLGMTRPARRWIVPVGSATSDEAILAVVNPGPAAVTVSVVAHGAEDHGSVEGAGAIEVPAGGRVEIDVTDGAGFHPTAFVVAADGEVVVGHRFTFADGEEAWSGALPLAD